MYYYYSIAYVFIRPILYNDELMKILVVSDATSPVLYDHYKSEHLRGIEMVISCGDLPGDYMEFIVSMLNVPCYFVPGNHDTVFLEKTPPGWIALDGKLVTSRSGITMLGLGGSQRYRPGRAYQYTEGEMRMRFLKLKPSIWLKRKQIDIVVTHAPPHGLGDLEDLPHRGFAVFREIITTYKPKYFLHGHVHLNYSQNPRILTHDCTRIINGYQYYVLDYNAGG